MGSQEVNRGNRKRRAKKQQTSSFLDYVNKVQSKMMELRYQSQASPKMDQKLSYSYLSKNASNVVLHNNRRHDIGKGKLKREKSPSRTFFSVHDSEASPTLAPHSKPLPRTLSPINHSKVKSQQKETRIRTLKKNEQLTESVSEKLKAQLGNSSYTIVADTFVNGIRREAPIVKSAGDARKSSRLQVDGESVKGDASPPTHIWNRKDIVSTNANVFLSLPQRVYGVSAHSLSSSGSSSNSSSRSTPFPSTPSHGSLCPSSTSLAVNELTSDSKLPNIHSISPSAITSSGLDNDQVRRERLSVSARSHLNTTLSLPHLTRGVSPRSLPTPTRSLGRSPVPSPYLMPVTKLSPVARPPRPSPVTSGTLKNKFSSKSKNGRHHSSLSKSMNGVYNDMATAFSPLPPMISVELSNDPPTSSRPTIPLLDLSIGLTSQDEYALRESDCSENSAQKVLNIPLITIRSATPIKTSSEDSDSLNSLCDKFELVNVSGFDLGNL